MSTVYDTAFQVRRGMIVRLIGLPNDLTVREGERLVRMIRTLAFPDASTEVCKCLGGVAAPGDRCPACGERIPETEREKSERIAGMTPAEIVIDAIGLEAAPRSATAQALAELRRIEAVAMLRTAEEFERQAAPHPEIKTRLITRMAALLRALAAEQTSDD